MTDYNTGTIIGIEKLTLQKWYTLNLNPDDSRQYWDNNTVLDRPQSMASYIDKYLIPILKQYAMVELYMEVSPKGRLHFHGVIMFTCNTHLRSFYLDYIHTILSKFTMTIGEINDKDVWYNYITKQQLIMFGKIVPFKTNDTLKIANYEIKKHLLEFNPVHFRMYPSEGAVVGDLPAEDVGAAPLLVDVSVPKKKVIKKNRRFGV